MAMAKHTGQNCAGGAACIVDACVAGAEERRHRVCCSTAKHLDRAEGCYMGVSRAASIMAQAQRKAGRVRGSVSKQLA